MTQENSKDSQGEKSKLVELEEEVLAYWKKNDIFNKTLEKDSPKGEFVFYDGPPFATGLPHYGSLLSSVIKDVIPRYKTMRGYHVRRRWGWDCHGLPIENIVEKQLGLKTKKDILSLGVEKFNRACRDSVLRYAHDWKKYVERIGRWVEFENAYRTMDNTYIESVWWALSKIHKKGLLYEGRKVLLYCPRCETPIAKAEVAMDNSYKDITEEAVTVKFRIKNPEEKGFPKDTYLLAWTTTPWTLPGNVALAVGENITYVLTANNVILAKSLIESTAGVSNTVQRELKGSELVGLEYEPLFKIEKVEKGDKKSHYVALADFVTTNEGTGIVHTAVIYGEDDYQLGVEKVLPMVPLLDQAGHFNDDAPKEIRGEYYKKAEKFIKTNLEERGLLFEKKAHTHSYPHCHRCDTPLIYNAVVSWFINIQNIKDRMLSLNEKIHWVPDHLKHGRFGNIVKDAPDWTISRNRFWASPLPIWKDEKGKITLVGSLEELKKHTKKSGNTYYVMRHGEAEHNVTGIISSKKENKHHLTQKGKEEVKQAAEKLREKNIDYVFLSPYKRTKETADMLVGMLAIPEENVVIDERLREFEFGDFEGAPMAHFLAHEAIHMKEYDTPTTGGESYLDAKRRFGSFLYEAEEKYSNKNILVVSHGIALETLVAVVEGASNHRSKEIIDAIEVPSGSFEKLDFVPLPHNERYDLDLHRPYIDNIELEDGSGSKLTRIPEVVDGWVESGSMPFAEWHYPFENTDTFEPKGGFFRKQKNYPADFIAEYIAQTRTWFYYMHAMSVLLFDDVSFKNVVTTGNILAEDGAKMSKSKGNYTNPLENVNRYGADALRYYLMNSVVMRAEDARFVDDELKEAHNRTLNILWNTYQFFLMHKESTQAVNPEESGNILDRWVLSRLGKTVREVTAAFDEYDTVRVTREMRDFVTDFSTWYVRRSRDRFKEKGEDYEYALATTGFVLETFSKVIAPVTPFIADGIYREVSNKKPSVHLEDWPRTGNVDEELLKEMEEVREVVSHALEARADAGIKVRQPLALLTIKSKGLEGKDELLELIKDEVNIKEIRFGDELSLDTKLTPELEEEGSVRDFIRHVQSLRKKGDFNPKDEAVLVAKGDAKAEELVGKNESEIKKATSLKEIRFEYTDGEDIKIGGGSLTTTLKK
ncbi:MAG: class I tRNA ligase family protein [Candidatus Paceibacterota bacterium]